MFSKFSEDVQKILVLSRKEMKELQHPYIGSEHLILAILKNDNVVSKKLNEFNITYEIFKSELLKLIGKGKDTNNFFLYTPLLKKIIENAIIDSRECGNNEVTVQDLFISMLEEGEGVAIRILSTLSVDFDELYDYFSTSIVNKSKSVRKLMIEEFGTDLNKEVELGNIDPVIDRDEEVLQLIEILARRSKNNPILIGEAGVGKTAIVEELARRIVNNEIPRILRNKRIISVSISSLVAGTKYRGEFEERLNKMLKEVEEQNDIIIFIDEVHTLIGAGGAEGAIDASNILKPSLARGKLQLIGATTTSEYKKFIESDKAFSRRFQKVFVEETDDKRTYNILRNIKKIYESFHGVLISDENLKYIVDMTNKYIHNRFQPDKSIDILDEVCAHVSLSNTKNNDKLKKLYQQLAKVKDEKNNAVMNQEFLLASDIYSREIEIQSKINKCELMVNKATNVATINKDDIKKIIESKTKIPIYELDSVSISKFTKLSNQLKKKICGQDKVIDELVDATKRFKLGLSASKRPISFLFVGPTGVGKTELVKEYASLLFNKDSLIRLDMSEFRESHSVSKLIGSPPGYVGYDDNANIFEKVRDNPHSVILLDEVEKASSVVLNLFLQILDEGKVKDSKGNVIYFENTIIIMTSNAVTELSDIGFSNNSNLISNLENTFSTEFLNRINHILLFNKLDEGVLKTIIKGKLLNCKRDYSLKGVKINIDKKIMDEIISLSDYNKFGARKITKILEDKIDNIVADNILNNIYQIKIDSVLN